MEPNPKEIVASTDQTNRKLEELEIQTTLIQILINW